MPSVVGVLLGIFAYISKNPVLLKLTLFSAFVSIIHFILSLVKEWLFPILQSYSTLSQDITFILCKLGFTEAINIVVSAYIVTFFLRHGLGFVKG